MTMGVPQPDAELLISLETMAAADFEKVGKNVEKVAGKQTSQYRCLFSGERICSGENLWLRDQIRTGLISS